MLIAIFLFSFSFTGNAQLESSETKEAAQKGQNVDITKTVKEQRGTEDANVQGG